MALHTLIRNIGLNTLMEALKHVMNAYLSFGMSRFRVTNLRDGLLLRSPCTLSRSNPKRDPLCSDLFRVSLTCHVV